MTPELITTPAALTHLAERFAAPRRLGLSTEDSSVRAFRPRLCLLALAFEGESGETAGSLIDLQAFERSPVRPGAVLGPLLGAAPVVMHAAEHAVAALRRDLHLELPRLVDTACAATLLGLPKAGYRSLCAELLGRTLPAAPSLDWRLRPLSAEASEGAWEDAAHLLALHDALTARIRTAELEDEWALASAEVAATRSRSNLTGPDSAWRLPEARALRPEQRAVLATLVAWREGKAREFDCPPGQIVPNRELVQLARTSGEVAVQRLAEPSAQGGFHSRLMWADREELRLILLSGGEDAGLGPAPRPTAEGRPTPAAQARLRRLKAWRSGEAARRGVGLQAILPAAVMEHLARHGREAVRETPGLGASRCARYAETLEALLDEQQR